MSFKKGNPGCPCTCGTAECFAQCFCAVRINMPTPDDVDEATGPSCPPSDCNITAKCWTCYLLLDGIFKKQTSRRYYVDDCGGLSYEYNNLDDTSCDTLFMAWGDPDTADNETPLACWNPANYDCPDCTDESYLQCISQYGIKGPWITLEINCSEGCCDAEIKISYSVHKYCDELVVIPDPAVSPATRYTHTFNATNLCSCDEVKGAVFSFSGTTSQNNSRGITVPDVCNAASATVSLVDNDHCGCVCFDCLDFSNEINVALTGGEFTGTVVATYEPYDAEPLEDRNVCTFRGIANGDTCNFTVVVTITCLPCEKYDIVVQLRTGDGIDECIAEYRRESADCSTLTSIPFYSVTGDCPCDLTDFTVSLS